MLALNDAITWMCSWKWVAQVLSLGFVLLHDWMQQCNDEPICKGLTVQRVYFTRCVVNLAMSTCLVKAVRQRVTALVCTCLVTGLHVEKWNERGPLEMWCCHVCWCLLGNSSKCWCTWRCCCDLQPPLCYRVHACVCLFSCACQCCLCVVLLFGQLLMLHCQRCVIDGCLANNSACEWCWHERNNKHACVCVRKQFGMKLMWNHILWLYSCFTLPCWLCVL